MYYFDEDNTTDFVDLFSLSPTLTIALEDRILENKTEALAAYTQWDFSFADALTLTVGGRYTDETKKVNFIANASPLLPAVTAPTRTTSANMTALGIPLEQSTKLFTPRVALKYDINQDVNLFASATRGFKSGGWNARGTTAVANQPFSPEKVWSYEAGLRSEWMDRKLRVNLTAFMLDVQDLQTPAAFVNPANGAISFITQNFAGLKNQGIEAEIIASPVDNLTLFAFFGTRTSVRRSWRSRRPARRSSRAPAAWLRAATRASSTRRVTSPSPCARRTPSPWAAAIRSRSAAT